MVIFLSESINSPRVIEDSRKGCQVKFLFYLNFFPYSLIDHFQDRTGSCMNCYINFFSGENTILPPSALLYFVATTPSLSSQPNFSVELSTLVSHVLISHFLLHLVHLSGCHPNLSTRIPPMTSIITSTDIVSTLFLNQHLFH